MRLPAGLFRKFVHKGRLRVHGWNGVCRDFGSGEDGPTVTIRLRDRSLGWKLLVNPELYAAEAYMDGTLTLEEGSTLYDLLHLFWINRSGIESYPTQRAVRSIWRRLRRLQQMNSVRSAKRHARAHYDLTVDFYRLFLDEGLNYSCAYFHSPEDTLEEAQEAKHIHALAKLRLEPGMSVLEIGGGWGSFAIRLAEAGAQVVSLNVSPEQIAVAEQRAAEAGVSDRVSFVLNDYREYHGSFDRVVSVGMMEHVGAGYLGAYFRAVRDFLKPDGYAFIHCIGRMEQPGTTGPFIRKYIFPGGYIPALSEVFTAIERCGLWCADVEILRMHYHYTIRHWRRRFEARRDEARALYDERFCKMWEFYLTAVELGFRYSTQMVFQLLLSKSLDAVPIRRDFMIDDERRLLAASRGPNG